MGDGAYSAYVCRQRPKPQAQSSTSTLSRASNHVGTTVALNDCSRARLRCKMATSVDAKMLRQTKFPPEFSRKVDMTKVNIEVMKK